MLYQPKYKDKTTGLRKQSKTWWYDFDFNGARIRESTGLTSKTAARQAENKRREDLRTGAAGLRRREARIFRLVASEYLDMKRANLSPRSYRIEVLNLKHLLPHFGGRLVTDIEGHHIASYQQARRTEGASPATVNLEVGTLRAILRKHRVWALVQPDVRMLRTQDDIGKALTVEEETRLLAECAKSRSAALLPAVTLALNTGLRYGELTALEWRQVDFLGRQVTVGKSKTKAGEGRTVPLNDRAFSMISTWAARFSNRKADHYVFPTAKYGEGGAAYDVDPTRSLGDLKEAWEAAKRRTADPEKELVAVTCRWHDLRHTFCTRVLERGTTLAVLADLMGWSPGTTARMAKRYGHLTDKARRDVVMLLDRPDSAETPKYSPKSNEDGNDVIV